MFDCAQLIKRAVQGHAKHAGKVVAVTDAQLSDPSGAGYRGEAFPKDEPLLVRIGQHLDPDWGVSEYPEEGLIDIYYDAEALPGQLQGEDYVSWIFGPTYYADGRVQNESWLGEPRDATPEELVALGVTLADDDLEYLAWI
jgi:hypothetical protein